jgi:hypothetical protein
MSSLPSLSLNIKDTLNGKPTHSFSFYKLAIMFSCFYKVETSILGIECLICIHQKCPAV